MSARTDKEHQLGASSAAKHFLQVGQTDAQDRQNVPAPFSVREASQNSDANPSSNNAKAAAAEANSR